ncbi:hypothetical protein V6N11_009684 [Hibiscus sabdariffa]|uniref:Secreted protein n=1 Tax=Hibiscus sabdariffa TaxID=183260 RepID=A0ABR2P654_9ROSI
MMRKRIRLGKGASWKRWCSSLVNTTVWLCATASQQKEKRKETGWNGVEGSVFIGAGSAAAAAVVGRRSRSFLQLEDEDAPT